jgi:hypothetical protein
MSGGVYWAPPVPGPRDLRDLRPFRRGVGAYQVCQLALNGPRRSQGAGDVQSYQHGVEAGPQPGQVLKDGVQSCGEDSLLPLGEGWDLLMLFEK